MGNGNLWGDLFNSVDALIQKYLNNTTSNSVKIEVLMEDLKAQLETIMPNLKVNIVPFGSGYHSFNVTGEGHEEIPLFRMSGTLPCIVSSSLRRDADGQEKSSVTCEDIEDAIACILHPIVWYVLRSR
ncbi:hypothetical protein K8R78_01270 [bacterium]|nr:hypothetical protein [bacterium]